MEELSKYEAEARRLRAEYGQDAEIPSALNQPLGRLGGSLPSLGNLTPVMPVEGRIAELCKQLTEAGQTLAIARARDAEARHYRKTSEAVFTELSERLMQAIQEHRESTPENVPYPR